MINHAFTSSKNVQNIIITDGNIKTQIPIEDILFVQAEHVYIRIHLINGKRLLHRISMRSFLNKLPNKKFLQIHRSYIVNAHFIKRWDNEQVSLPGHVIPISRSRRKLLDNVLLSA